MCAGTIATVVTRTGDSAGARSPPAAGVPLVAPASQGLDPPGTVVGTALVRSDTSTLNEPELLYQPAPSMPPRNSRVAPPGTVTRWSAPTAFVPSPMKNTCLS